MPDYSEISKNGDVWKPYKAHVRAGEFWERSKADHLKRSRVLVSSAFEDVAKPAASIVPTSVANFLFMSER